MPLLRSPSGTIVNVPDDQLGSAQASGYAPVSLGEAAQTTAAKEAEDTGLLGGVNAFATGTLSGLTLGGSDYALKGLLNEGQFERLKAGREQHGGSAMLGQIAGAVIPAFVAPESLLAKTPAGVLSRASAGLAEGGGAVRVLGAAGLEGAVQNAGAYLSDTALGDRELSAEGLNGALGSGFAFGVAGGAVAHGVIGGTIAARRMFARVADGGEQAAKDAAAAWDRASTETIAANDSAADVARAKLARMRSDVARKQARAAELAQRAEAAGADAAKVQGDINADFASKFKAAQEAQTAGDVVGPVSTGNPVLDEATRLANRAEAGKLALRAGIEPTDENIARLLAEAERKPSALDRLTTGLSETPEQRYAALEAAAADEQKLAAALAEHDAAKADLEDLLRSIEAPTIEPGAVPRPTGVPVAEFGAPGQRGYTPGEVAAPRPPEAVEAAPGQATAQLRKPVVSEGTPVKTAPGIQAIGEPSANLTQQIPEGVPEGLTFDAAKRTYRGDVEVPPVSEMNVGLAPRAEATPVKAEPFSDQEYESYKKAWGHAADAHYASELRYSKGGDEVVNPALRSGKPLEGEAVTLRDGLDAAFREPESRIPRDMTLYRGLSDNPLLGSVGVKKRFADVKPGDVLEDPAYTSTAYSAEAKSRNEDVVFTIHAPAGTPAIPLRSHYTFEGEMLLPRGTKFRVDSIEYVPVSERWNMSGYKDFEVLPDKSVRLTMKNGESHVKPPIKDISVTVIDAPAGPVTATRAPRVDLSAPIDKLSLRQLGEYQDELNSAFDKATSGTPEYDRLSKLWDEAAIRRNSISDNKIPDVPDYNPSAAVPASDLESQLGAMKGKLDEGAQLGKLSKESPAAQEYVAAKAEKTAAAAEHFRAKANAKNYAGSDMAVAERAANSGAAQDDFFANLTRPKTRNDYVAQNIGRAMKEEGSHAAALAKVEKEWAEMSGHPLSVAKLEQQLDAATERAATATEPAERAAAEQEAKVIEDHLSQVGARPGPVEDIAAIAPVVTRYEKASAQLTEALGDAAPPQAQAAAKAYRDAEAAAERKMVDRTTRAVDDEAARQERLEQQMMVGKYAPRKPTAKELGVMAKADKLKADAEYAKAVAAESEAKLGAAGQPKLRSIPGGKGKAPEGIAGKVANTALMVGMGVELADDVGLTGLPHPKDIPVVGGLLSAYLKYRLLKAAVGRFVGRIPASGDARAAALSSQVKDKIAGAVDKTLGVAEATARKGKPVVVAATVRAADALRNRVFDDGKPGADKDATLTQLAAVRAREVAAAATRPDLVVAQVRRELADVHDPDLLAAAEKHRVAIYQHLNEVAPKAPPDNPFTKRTWEPSPAAAMKFARQIQAAFDPVAVFEAVNEQCVTPEAAATLRATSPKLFGMAQERLISRAQDLKEPVPHRQLQQASILFDVNLTPGMQPENLAALQSVQSKIQPPQQPAAPAPSMAAATNVNTMYAPTSDRRAMMR